MHFRLSFLCFCLTLAGQAQAFPGWLNSPTRSNPLDPKSSAWVGPPAATPLPTATPVRHDFHVHLKDFWTAHLGKPLGFRLADATDGSELANRYLDMTTTPQCNISVVIPDGVPDGVSLNMDLMAEYGTMDGVLDGADHTYRQAYPAVTADVNSSYQHTGGFTNIVYFNVGTILPPAAKGYTLKVSLVNFDIHTGQLLVFRLRDRNSLQRVAHFKIDALSYPCHEIFIFAALGPGASYDFDFFADHNGNGSYDAPPTDHAWRHSTFGVSGDVEVVIDHNAYGQSDIGPIAVP